MEGNVIPMIWDASQIELADNKIKEAEMVCGETIILDGAYAIR